MAFPIPVTQMIEGHSSSTSPRSQHLSQEIFLTFWTRWRNATSSSTLLRSTTLQAARNLIVFDIQMNFTNHILACRFMLCDIRKIRAFLSDYAVQILVQALFVAIHMFMFCTYIFALALIKYIHPKRHFYFQTCHW